VQLSIIIVNYNVKYFLEQCLYSVQSAIAGLQAEVVVVDNNSTDGSAAYLQPIFPWVKWILNKQNTGFGVANNQAVEIATGEYILFLNPDTLLPEDCLEECLNFMQAHSQAGALGIKMLDGSGQYLPESKRGFPSPLTSLFKLSGLAAKVPRSRVFARYYMGHLSKEKSNPIDVLAGAFMLVRRSILQQIGAFDEQFFMYGEDIDLSYRIQKAGWQNWYFADSTIIHFKGESTKKGSLNYVRMFYQAMNLFVKKHYSGGSALLYRWLIQTAIGGKAAIAAATSFLKRKHSCKEENSALKQLLVFASATSYQQVQALLTRAGKLDTTLTLASLNGLSQQSLSDNNQGILFCLDEAFPMKKAIAIMEQHPQLQYFFYYKDSNSIVSSSSKETSGQWVAAAF
jgi:O-antigen biosynthesis protein